MKTNNMFIAAGVQTIFHIVRKFLNENEYRNYMKSICPKGLISFGINLSKKNIDKKLDMKKYIESIRKLSKGYKEISDIHDLYLDSGGYQVTTGLVSRSNIDNFIDGYVEYLNKNKDYYDVAFSLDIPSLPDESKTELLYKLNKKSYNIIDDLDDDIKDRLLFVSHFRLVELYKIWNKLIFEDELIKKYSKFSIGGLVASQPAAKKLQFDLYSLGVLQIIFGLNKQVPDPFHFHILGSATSTNTIYFSLLEKLFEDLLNVKTQLTFDSSAVFTKVQVGRSFTYFNEDLESCWDVDLRSAYLDEKHKCGKTNREIILEVCNEIKTKANLSLDIKEDIYDPSSDTFYPEMRPYILGLECYALNKVSEFCRKRSEQLYKLYKTDPLKFVMELEKMFTKFNKGKISNVSSAKVTSIKSSLDTIVDFILNKTESDLFDYFNSLGPVLDTSELRNMDSQFDILGG